MTKLDGNNLSKNLLNNLKNDIVGKHLNFVCILVGDDPASKTYINNKKNKCEYVGINFILVEFPDNIPNNILINKINELNNNKDIHAYIIQLPLPNHIEINNILNIIDKKKDVDCFHPENVGNIILNNPYFYPATPYGICLLLDHYNITTEGQNITIIGKSNIVGNPLSLMLSNENNYRGTVTLCDKYTNNLKSYVEHADILIVAAGVHHLIDQTYKVKQTVTLIDVGIHKISDVTKKNGYKLEGDIDFNYFEDKCKYITPVPGGVGPMTVYALLFNISRTVLNY